MDLFNELYAGREIVIRGSTYQVLAPPVLSGQTATVCWMESREAFHWRLQKRAGPPNHFLLKVMKLNARMKRLSDLQDKLQAHYSQVAGFQLDQRICLTRGNDAETLRQFPELEYAILMPWLAWKTWTGLVQALSNKQTQYSYTWQQAQQLSYATAQVLYAMEFKGHAHTDIEGRNILYDEHFRQVALVDLEGFYMRDLDPPVIANLGTSGYQHHETRRNGQWSIYGDRFAGAILLTEMLTLWSDDVLRPGATTLFQQDELQEVKGDWHRDLVYQTLQRFGNPGLPELFRRAWDSPQLLMCPSLGEWRDAIQTIQGIHPQLTSSTSQPGTWPSGHSQPGSPWFGQSNSWADPSQPSSPSPALNPNQSSTDSLSLGPDKGKNTKGLLKGLLKGRRKLILALAVGGVAALGLGGWAIANSVGSGPGSVNRLPTPVPPTPTPTPTPHVSTWARSASGQTSSLAPTLIVWQRTLYMYFVDTTPNQGNTLTVVPVSGSSTPLAIANHASSQTPALASKGTTLTMAYVANNFLNTLLVTTSTDGLTWNSETTLNQSSATAPALASLGSTMYMAFVSDDNDHVILISSDTDGFNSNQPTQFNSDLAPTLLADQEGGTLIMAFVDTKRNNDLLITTSTDGATWSATQPTQQSASAAPALAYLGTTLYLVFPANDGSDTLQFISSQDMVNWSSAQSVGAMSTGAPSLALWNQGLTLAYVDSSDNLQIATSQE